MSGKALLVVLDGLGDRGARTPLGEAKTPCLDELAGRALTGRMLSLGSWTVPGSDTAHLALLGYDPYETYKGRGTFEALGAGMKLAPGEVAFRCNLCTVDEQLVVKDRRAGRKDDGFAELYRGLDNMELEDCRARLLHTVEHRGALVLSGPGLSHAVGNTDPHEAGARVAESRALAPGGEKAARLLNLFTRRSYEILNHPPANERRRKAGLLPGNIILSRGAGFVADVQPFPRRFGLSACCIAGGALYKGVAQVMQAAPAGGIPADLRALLERLAKEGL